MTGHIHITPLGGIAGDMFAAGMLDAFPDLAGQVLAATAAVLPHQNARLEACQKAGIAARHFIVPAQGTTAPIHYTDMDEMLAHADIGQVTKTHARAMLRSLAKAEAKVHGIALERVHFHEIADWDTLADLTAAAALFDHLTGWSWSFDPFPLGSGRVKTAHGLLPVPAPATAILLQGLMMQDDGVPGERVTPTGAAIARYIADTFPLQARPMGRLHATGYGAGFRDLPGMANVMVAQVIAGKAQPGDSVAVLEWDIDDMTAEEIAVACDHLRACPGVLDVVTLALSGKKGRPATGFRLMAQPAHADAAARAVFDQTSTLGLRRRMDQRLILPRQIVPGAKRAQRPTDSTIKAESDTIATAPTLAARRAKAREGER